MFDRRAILTALLATAVSFSDAFQQPLAYGNAVGNTGSSTVLNMSTEAAAKKLPGTAQMDKPWEKLGFEFRPTNSHVQLKWKEGEGWSEPEIIKVRRVCQTGKESDGACWRVPFAIAVAIAIGTHSVCMGCKESDGKDLI